MTNNLRIPIFPLLLVLLAISAGVSGQGESSKPLVVASASIFADIASVIGGDHIETRMIVPVGGDPHIYEPTPGDARLVVQANLILKNGLTFEGWINELIENSGTKADVVTITEGIEPISSTQYENAADPHAWMDPVNGKQYALNILNALKRLLPAFTAEFDSNYTAYIRELDALDRFIREQISTIPEDHRILITSHDAFQYYGRRYGIRLESVLGTSTDADVRTSDLIRLNEVIQNSQVPVVFIESTINPKLLEQVARDNGITIGGKLYSDSLGDKDSPANTYLNMIRHNTETIVHGLTRERLPAESGQTSSTFKPWMWIAGLALLGLVVILFIRKRRVQPL